MKNKDALDILNGKWKLLIIISLTFGDKRFTEIAKEVQGIIGRMLSRELQNLEINRVIQRRIKKNYPVRITYALTSYSIIH